MAQIQNKAISAVARIGVTGYIHRVGKAVVKKPTPSGKSQLRKVQPAVPSLFAASSIGSTFVIPKRYVHTGSQPAITFNNIRRKDSKSMTELRGANDKAHKAFSYAFVGGMTAVGVYLGKEIITDVMSSLDVTQDILALSKLEFDMEDVPVGTSVLMSWAGQPLFVRHRTPEEIEEAQNVDLLSLRDPQHDSDRSQVPEFMILLGICTHLGCIPTQDAGMYQGGMFCPCHGSHYDSSGRIRKGPAPLNLEPAVHVIRKKEVIVG